MRYAMQSWEGDSDEGDHWENMHDDSRPAIAKHWRPRETALEAAVHCLAWVGFIGIPAMQVVDLNTGEAVWRYSDAYPAAGPKIELEEEHLVRAGARAIWNGRKPEPIPAPDQPTLF